ncbi:MepB family protein [Longirhabdus pacifica]|uniref:MepB family protein n=1 Tax=Longirhabdus pacifica TaxID=2305227 RepID=UPI0010086C5C|nr:MepB family protein [Longirhabdus pacifica]
MDIFYTTLIQVNNMIYEPNGLTLTSIREERQNVNYGAGTFKLNVRSVRFRVARKTPHKVGQFVSFWEKDEHDKNQPYCYEDAPDLLVIHTFFAPDKFGQFIFPKEILFKQNIFRTSNTKGKMAMRVYPSWDTPTSKQGIITQKWQLPYFVDLRNVDDFMMKKILALYRP